MADKANLNEYFKSEEKEKKQKKSRSGIFGKKNNEKRSGKEKPKKDPAQADIDIEEGYPASYKAMAAARVLVWVILGFIVLRGVYYTVFPPRPEIREEKYVQALSETDTVKSFAEQFVREYLTYDSKDLSEYKQRLEKYTGGMAVSSVIGWSKVTDTDVWQTQKIDDNTAVVTVYAKLTQGKEQEVNLVQPEITQINVDPVQQQQANVGGNANVMNISKEVYVKVAVRINDENHITLIDYPVFLSDFDPITDYYANYADKLENTADKVRGEIKETIDNFFKIYDDGTREQISYFMLNSQKIKGFEGKYIYDSIDTFESYKLNNSETKAIAVVGIRTHDEMGTSFKQKFSFLMRKEKAEKEMRWYIERFIDTGENLNQLKDNDGRK